MDKFTAMLVYLGICLVGYIIYKQYKHVDSRLKKDTEKFTKISIQGNSAKVLNKDVTDEESVRLMLYFSVKIAKQIGVDEKNMVTTINELYKNEDM